MFSPSMLLILAEESGSLGQRQNPKPHFCLSLREPQGIQGSRVDSMDQPNRPGLLILRVAKLEVWCFPENLRLASLSLGCD